jgi:hypothetical protein
LIRKPYYRKIITCDMKNICISWQEISQILGIDTFCSINE